ncbi:MAG: hypothetical protein ACF8R9_05615 [Phycisphaerales bacterium JB054]
MGLPSGRDSDLLPVFEDCFYRHVWPDPHWYDDDRVHALYKVVHFAHMFETTTRLEAIASGLWINYAAGAPHVDENVERSLLNLITAIPELSADLAVAILSLLMRVWTRKQGEAKAVYGLALAILLHDFGQQCFPPLEGSRGGEPGEPVQADLDTLCAHLAESLTNRSEWLTAIHRRAVLLRRRGETNP